MSIIIGFITKQFGLIASDGRQFGSAKLENGHLKEKAQIISEAFDKTFSLKEGKIIGASAGLTTFENKKISEHLEELTQKEWADSISVEENIRNTINSFSIQLQNVDNAEVLFEHRKVDIILISSKKLGLVIYSYRLFPCQDKQEIQISFERIPDAKKVPGLVHWKLFGDDSAQASAIKYIDRAFKKPNRNIKFLMTTIKKSISVGIKNAKIHPYGDELSCGGQIFTRHIK